MLSAKPFGNKHVVLQCEINVFSSRVALNCSKVQDGISRVRIHTTQKSLLRTSSFCKIFSHVVIDHCFEDVKSERNIGAKILNSNAPSSSRSAEG